jgi:hypothetical protein
MNLHELGYYFHPMRRIGDPGYPQLDVNVVAAPTHHHYDTRQATFPVSAFGGVQRLDVRHPWHASRYHVCPGTIVLTDFVDKRVEAFSFGGDMQTVESADHTLCMLTSTAPIIHLVDDEFPATILGEEFEALLARRHAAHAGHEDDFDARLIKADPLRLYIACLIALQQMIERMPRGCNALLGDALSDARSALESAGQWPMFPPYLEDIL